MTQYSRLCDTETKGSQWEVKESWTLCSMLWRSSATARQELIGSVLIVVENKSKKFSTTKEVPGEESHWLFCFSEIFQHYGWETYHCVSGFPILYEISLLSYRDMKTDLWKQIGNIVGMPGHASHSRVCKLHALHTTPPNLQCCQSSVSANILLIWVTNTNDYALSGINICTCWSIS